MRLASVSRLNSEVDTISILVMALIDFLLMKVSFDLLVVHVDIQKFVVPA